MLVGFCLSTLAAKFWCVCVCAQLSSRTILLKGEVRIAGTVEHQGESVSFQSSNDLALDISRSVTQEEARNGQYIFTPENPSQAMDVFMEMLAAREE